MGRKRIEIAQKWLWSLLPDLLKKKEERCSTRACSGCYSEEVSFRDLLKMFWREKERENIELSGGPPCGQVRVLVVGDSGR